MIIDHCLWWTLVKHIRELALTGTTLDGYADERAVITILNEPNGPNR